MPHQPTADPRRSPIEIDPEEFRTLGHHLVDQVAEFLRTLPDRSITPGESPSAIKRLLGDRQSLPNEGAPLPQLLDQTARLFIDHSLFNGHPRFFGYITSSAAPVGALADFLAAAVNPNVGSFWLSPVATEIELQTVRWIAELIGYPASCGGLLVSGGNMANFVGFLAGRKAKSPIDVRAGGTAKLQRTMRIYASTETHTWLQKAADLFGLGTESVRWIPTDNELRMNVDVLHSTLLADRAAGDLPFLIVGTAGSVATGAIDPLRDIAGVAKQFGCWFHIDGAYGGFAAALPDGPSDLHSFAEADSIAIDPHKWLYAPLEAGCALVRDPNILRETFSYHPSYYHFQGDPNDEPVSLYEYGPQNSRGFRAFKVWLGLQQVGRAGYVQMIRDDIRLAEVLYQSIAADAELEPATLSLSIATFRFVPKDLASRTDQPGAAEYLNTLNTELLTRLQRGGEVYVSNAVVGGKFLLRACIVNFRTSVEDVRVLPQIVVRVGRVTDEELRPTSLR
jgi:aromatic-L-amino-acid decarboxylase